MPNPVGLLFLNALTVILLFVLVIRSFRAKIPAITLDLRDGQARIEGICNQIERLCREEMSAQRQEAANSWEVWTQKSSTSASELRGEINARQDSARQETRSHENEFRNSLETRLSDLRREISDGLQASTQRQTEAHENARNSLDGTLTRFGHTVNEMSQTLSGNIKGSMEGIERQVKEMATSNEQRHDRLRESVERRLDSLEKANTSKLEEMRATVDEKLHKTLESRLTESFGLVSDQLGKVQNGLGQMQELALGVGDLKRVLTNVKVRGGFAEVQLRMQLEQVLSKDQYKENVNIDPSTKECVEFAIRLPNSDGEVLLPIDAKFPREDWERLEDAANKGDTDGVSAAAKALEITIKNEAKKIGNKYIRPTLTTNFAIMFLPTEGLFAEVVRRPGLADELQSKYRVCVAGPTTFMALLNSLQMGFKTLAIQQKGVEVWRVLAATKHEFEKFGGLMGKIESHVDTVQSTLRKITSKTTTINRKLRGVDSLDMTPLEATALLGLESDAPEDTPEIVGDSAGDPWSSQPESTVAFTPSSSPQ